MGPGRHWNVSESARTSGRRYWRSYTVTRWPNGNNSVVKSDLTDRNKIVIKEERTEIQFR